MTTDRDMTDRKTRAEAATAHAREMREDFGPQWGSVSIMLSKLLKCSPDSLEKLTTDTDVDSTMRKISARQNLYEATGRSSNKTIAQANSVSEVVHTIAAIRGIDQELMEEACVAVRAVCMRHTIGSNGFSDDDYDALTADWNLTFGII